MPPLGGAGGNAALPEGYYNDEGVGGEDTYYGNGQAMGRGRMMG